MVQEYERQLNKQEHKIMKNIKASKRSWSERSRSLFNKMMPIDNVTGLAQRETT